MKDVFAYIIKKLDDESSFYWIILVCLLVLNFTLSTNASLAGLFINNVLVINWTFLSLLSKYICNLSAVAISISVIASSILLLPKCLAGLELAPHSGEALQGIQVGAFRCFMLLILPEYLIQMLQNIHINIVAVTCSMLGNFSITIPLFAIYCGAHGLAFLHAKRERRGGIR